ncbi:MAG: ferritin-like domain-containing protein [Actinomycetota bacterium]|nr:ferritin-like domain-containing protein [Actinomycetota bacterium]
MNGPKTTAEGFADARRWEEHFEQTASSSRNLPLATETLSGAERMVVAASIQAFQLGETGGGSFLLRAAERRGERRGDFPYLRPLKLFVLEEQRHAGDLGRFMELERIPAISRQWTNTAFRWIRKLMGIELCIVTLLTAELIAMSYYRALRKATNAPVLKALCGRILKDEASHVVFQAAMLKHLRHGRPQWLIRSSLLLQRLLLLLTVAAVWIDHRRCFRAGGYSLARLHRESQRWLTRVGA